MRGERPAYGEPLVKTSPLFKGCTFSRNWTGGGGAAALVTYAWPEFIGCEISGNRAELGCGGLELSGDALERLQHDQSLAGRMHHHHGRLAQFFDAWHTLFPPEAEYRHDQMELRSELTEEQKEVEPRNADSHLTFIGSGMRNCVTYRNDPLAPVYFIDLDGTNGQARRQRQTTVVAYDDERVVARDRFTVPVSHHPSSRRSRGRRFRRRSSGADKEQA